jgi:hypothetical protein
MGLLPLACREAWMSVSCKCCVCCQVRSLWRTDHSSRGVLLSVMCLSVIAKSQRWRGVGPLGLSSHERGGGRTIIYLLSSREVIAYHSKQFYFLHFLNIGTFRTLISSPMSTIACRDEIKCTVLWGGNVKMCSTNLIVQPASVLALSGERASVWPTYTFRGFVTRNKNFKIKVFWHVTPCRLFVQGRRAP